MNYRKFSAKILFLMVVNSCSNQQAMYRTSLYKPAAPTAASQSAVAATGNQKQFPVPITQASTDLMQQATAQPQSQPWTNQQFSGAFKTTRPNLFRASSKITRDEAFKILDLKGDETEAQIKAAYRKAVLAAHPDAGGDTEKMKLINEAMDVIRKISQDNSKKSYRDQSSDDSEQKRQETKWDREEKSQKTEWDREEKERQGWTDQERQTFKRRMALGAGMGVTLGVASGIESDFDFSIKPLIQLPIKQSLQIKKNWLETKPWPRTVLDAIEKQVGREIGRNDYSYEIIDDGDYWKVVFVKK